MPSRPDCNHCNIFNAVDGGHCPAITSHVPVCASPGSPAHEVWMAPDSGDAWILWLDSQLTPEQRLSLLDHPIFRGRCPVCDFSIRQPASRFAPWLCDRCRWCDQGLLLRLVNSPQS